MQGKPNAADPATVLQRGPSILPVEIDGDGSHGAVGLMSKRVGKATGVATRTAGAGRLFFYESSSSSCRKELREGEEDPQASVPRPASQETCHP